MRVLFQENLSLFLDVVVLPRAIAESFNKLKGFAALAYEMITPLDLCPSLYQNYLPWPFKAKSPDRLESLFVDGYPIIDRNSLKSAIDVGSEYILPSLRPYLSDKQPFIVKCVKQT